jgi:hypothetical protein
MPDARKAPDADPGCVGGNLPSPPRSALLDRLTRTGYRTQSRWRGKSRVTTRPAQAGPPITPP